MIDYTWDQYSVLVPGYTLHFIINRLRGPLWQLLVNPALPTHVNKLQHGSTIHYQHPAPITLWLFCLKRSKQPSRRSDISIRISSNSHRQWEKNFAQDAAEVLKVKQAECKQQTRDFMGVSANDTKLQPKKYRRFFYTAVMVSISDRTLSSSSTGGIGRTITSIGTICISFIWAAWIDWSVTLAHCIFRPWNKRW